MILSMLLFCSRSLHITPAFFLSKALLGHKGGIAVILGRIELEISVGFSVLIGQEVLSALAGIQLPVLYECAPYRSCSNSLHLYVRTCLADAPHNHVKAKV